MKKNIEHFSFDRLEHTIGKQIPVPSEDRSRFTVLARMQRVENTINEMGQTMDNIHTLLKHIDDRLDRIYTNNTQPRSSRSIMSNVAVKFSSVKEEIP